MSDGPKRRSSRGACLAVLALLSGCSFVGHSDVGVSFFTEPPGARVIVDKKDSGFVTPCKMTLAADDHRVQLELPGYRTAKIALEGSRSTDIVYWRDMTIRAENWKFPLWLNLNDSVEPFKFRQMMKPGRVYVRLQRASEP
jgi:hypothetical protein